MRLIFKATLGTTCSGANKYEVYALVKMVSFKLPTLLDRIAYALINQMLDCSQLNR